MKKKKEEEKKEEYTFPDFCNEPNVTYDADTSIDSDIDDDDEFDLDAIPFQRIPGLPYTLEERIESLRQAEENIAAGLVYDHEEVMEEMFKFIWEKD